MCERTSTILKGVGIHVVAFTEFGGQASVIIWIMQVRS
jgi:hypothetical protein